MNKNLEKIQAIKDAISKLNSGYLILPTLKSERERDKIVKILSKIIQDGSLY